MEERDVNSPDIEHGVHASESEYENHTIDDGTRTFEAFQNGKWTTDYTTRRAMGVVP